MIGHLLRPEIEELIREKKWDVLRETFCEFHPSDIAEILADVPDADEATGKRIKAGSTKRLHELWDIFADTFPAQPFLGGHESAAEAELCSDSGSMNRSGVPHRLVMPPATPAWNRAAIVVDGVIG